MAGCSARFSLFEAVNVKNSDVAQRNLFHWFESTNCHVMNMLQSQNEGLPKLAVKTVAKDVGDVSVGKDFSGLENTYALNNNEVELCGGNGGDGGSGGGGGGGDENGDGDSEEAEFGPIMKFEEIMKELETRGASLPSDMLEAAKSVGICKGSAWPLGYAMKLCAMLRNHMLADPSFHFKIGTEKFRSGAKISGQSLS